MEIRPLRRQDDRSRFRSGDRALDRFFGEFAGQNQFRHHLGVTYVAVEGEHILGFATVAPAQLEADTLPASLRKRLSPYPLPVLRLARLAVHRSARTLGIGTELLRFVCMLAIRMSDELGCVGLLVDAKRDAVAFYEKYGFLTCDEVLEGSADARPRLRLLFLPIRAIRQARETL